MINWLIFDHDYNKTIKPFISDFNRDQSRLAIITTQFYRNAGPYLKGHFSSLQETIIFFLIHRNKVLTSPKFVDGNVRKSGLNHYFI